MGKLDGRVAAVTGGRAGVGLAIAEAFLDRGAGVLVNAGGAGDLQPVVALDPSEWDHTLRWNLYATFRATKRALPDMLSRSWAGSSTSPRSRASTARRWCRPTSRAQEVARAAVLLASELGGGISGSTMSVDGGTTAY